MLTIFRIRSSPIEVVGIVAVAPYTAANEFYL